MDTSSRSVSEYEQLVLNLMSVDGDSLSSYWNDAALLHTKELSLPRPLMTMHSNELQKKALDMYKACICSMLLSIGIASVLSVSIVSVRGILTDHSPRASVGLCVFRSVCLSSG